MSGEIKWFIHAIRKNEVKGMSLENFDIFDGILPPVVSLN